MRNFPLFPKPKKVKMKKRRIFSKARRKIADEQEMIDSERSRKKDIVQSKCHNRLARHCDRRAELKGCFKFTFIKKQKSYFRNLRCRGSNPRYRRQRQKKTKQAKVIMQKVEKTASEQEKNVNKEKRSKSTPVESKLYELNGIKVRIASKIEQVLELLPGKNHNSFIRFSDVEKQFGEVIARIKSLKFAVKN